MADIFSFSLSKPATPAERLGQRDWSNQELSDFYRAVAMLNQAGIAVHTDRGLTDEGEPWVGFCRVDGEVFIHFCRLDGRYLLDSPALDRPLLGNSFSALIDRFIERAAPAAAPNVVAFRQNKVLLHPAALLTILVWTLYVTASQHGSPLQAGELSPDDLLAALNPAAQADDTGMALLTADGHSSDDGAGTRGAAAKAADGKGIETKGLDGAGGDKSLVRLFAQLEAQAHGQAGNIAAVQLLAAISLLALGAHSGAEAEAPEASTTPMLAGMGMAPALLQLEAPEARSDGAAEMAPEAPAAVATVDAAKTASAIVVDAVLPGALPALLVRFDGAALGGLDMGAASHEHAATAEPTPSPDEGGAAAAPAVASTAMVAPAVVIAAVPPAPKAEPLPLSFSAVTDKIDFTELASYRVDGIDVFSSIDLDKAGTIVLTRAPGDDDAAPGLIVVEAPQLEPVHDQPGSNMMAYDDAARRFVEHFITHGGDVELVASANEVLLIDVTAFDEVTDHAFARSWVLADGGVVSTIGHFEMFAGFDMLLA